MHGSKRIPNGNWSTHCQFLCSPYPPSNKFFSVSNIFKIHCQNSAHSPDPLPQVIPVGQRLRGTGDRDRCAEGGYPSMPALDPASGSGVLSKRL